MQHSEISITDRFLAFASYLTLGAIGVVWLIVNTLVIKKPMNKFLMYNIVQSIVLSLIYTIIVYAYEIAAGLLFAIPFVGKLLYMIHIFIVETPIFFTMSLINFLIIIFLGYLALFAVLGQLPRVPYITNMVKSIWQ